MTKVKMFLKILNTDKCRYSHFRIRRSTPKEGQLQNSALQRGAVCITATRKTNFENTISVILFILTEPFRNIAEILGLN